MFDEERPLLTIDTDGSVRLITAADLNGDGSTDALVARLLFLTLETFEISILLNDQQGGLEDATQQVFEGPVPRVQHPTTVLLRDFNGDGRTDIFIADSGMDTSPFPGYQNTLVLSAPGGKLVDAIGTFIYSSISRNTLTYLNRCVTETDKMVCCDEWITVRHASVEMRDGLQLSTTVLERSLLSV